MGRGRHLALHTGPYRDIHRTSFGDAPRDVILPSGEAETESLILLLGEAETETLLLWLVVLELLVGGWWWHEAKSLI